MKGATLHFQVTKKRRKLAYIGKFKTGVKKAIEDVNPKRYKTKMTKPPKRP